jgi:hypothetical protein
MITPLVLAADVPGMASYYVMVAPGLVIGLLVLNLPLAATVLRRARMDERSRTGSCVALRLYATISSSRGWS